MSYSYADAMIALIDQTLANLPVSVPSNRVDIPGNKFTKPDNGYWARLSFTTITSENITPCYKRDEVNYAVDLFYPKDSGIIQQMRDSEALRAIIENVDISNARTDKATINDLGEDGPWYHIQIEQPFTFEGQ